MISRVAKNRKTERRKKTYTKPCYNADDIFKFYKEEVKGKDPKYKISQKMFKTILEEYNKELVNQVLNESQVVKLPYRLGEIAIKKSKMGFRKLKLDYAYFNKTGKKAFHLNEHSNEWWAKFYWKKKSCLVPNKGYYSFTPVNTIKKAIAKIMKTPNGHCRFYEI